MEPAAEGANTAAGWEQTGGQRWARNRQREVTAFCRVFPAPPKLLSVCVCVCVCAHVPSDELLFELVKRILIAGDTQKKDGRTGWGWNYQAAASKHPPTLFFFFFSTDWLPPSTLRSAHVMCMRVCTNVILSVPHGQLNGNIFKMRNIWSLLIGQFLLPLCAAFFHSKNQWKG